MSKLFTCIVFYWRTMSVYLVFLYYYKLLQRHHEISSVLSVLVCVFLIIKYFVCKLIHGKIIPVNEIFQTIVIWIAVQLNINMKTPNLCCLSFSPLAKQYVNIITGMYDKVLKLVRKVISLSHVQLTYIIVLLWIFGCEEVIGNTVIALNHTNK